MPAVHPRRRRQQFADAQPKGVCPLVDVTGVQQADPPHEEDYTNVYGTGFGESETGQAKAEVFDETIWDWRDAGVISWSDTLVVIDVEPIYLCVTIRAVRITNHCGNSDELWF